MASDTRLLLIQHLCLEAGRLMENTSAQLAQALPAGPVERAAQMLRIQQASDDISSLVDAASALDRLAREPD